VRALASPPVRPAEPRPCAPACCPARRAAQVIIVPQNATGDSQPVGSTSSLGGGALGFMEGLGLLTSLSAKNMPVMPTAATKSCEKPVLGSLCGAEAVGAIVGIIAGGLLLLCLAGVLLYVCCSVSCRWRAGGRGCAAVPVASRGWREQGLARPRRCSMPPVPMPHSGPACSWLSRCACDAVLRAWGYLEEVPGAGPAPPLRASCTAPAGLSAAPP
jgi:hypothetical protein